MSDDRELDDGLAAFDQLGQTMAETNELLTKNMASHIQRTELDHLLAVDLQEALRRATSASQKALEASNTEIRRYLLWTALTALLTLLVASGGGYWLGSRAGTEQGQAEGYQAAREEQAAASWANTPSGRRAYGLDQRGSLDMLARCSAPGWTTERRKDGIVCFPKSDANGQTSGWYLP